MWRTNLSVPAIRPRETRSAAPTPTPLAAVAHGLRQPTAAALLTAEFIDELLDARAPAEVLRRQTALIRRSMQHALRLTNTLLLAEQVEAGALHLSRRPTNVVALLDEAALSAAPHARAKRIDVRVAAVGALPPANVDAHLLLQALANVVGNAIHFTPLGGRLRLHASFDGAALRIEVTDSGPGMSEEGLARLFEPVSHGRARRARGGSGLGLAIARRIVELHGGAIGADNVPGGGLRVWLTFAQDHAERRRVAASTTSRGGEHSPGR